jgi:nitrogen fixation NifU-like protein
LTEKKTEVTKAEKMADDIDKLAASLQETILEGYSKKFKEELFNPRNLGKIENPDSHVRIKGVCGDTIEMSLIISDEKIHDVKYLTDGCGATVACASYVTRKAQGKSIEEALQMEPDDVVRYFEGLPEEHKHCAKLAVITLKAAVEEYLSKSNGNSIDTGE